MAEALTGALWTTPRWLVMGPMSNRRDDLRPGKHSAAAEYLVNVPCLTKGQLRSTVSGINRALTV